MPANPQPHSDDCSDAELQLFTLQCLNEELARQNEVMRRLVLSMALNIAADFMADDERDILLSIVDGDL